MTKKHVLNLSNLNIQLSNSTIDLRKYTHITEEAAHALVTNYNNNLVFPSLVTINRQVAKALSTHRFDLSFLNIKTISECVAKELGNHKGGNLDLRNLRIISDSIAEGLFNHGGSITIIKTASISDHAAFLLAIRCGGGSDDPVCNHEDVIHNYKIWMCFQEYLTPASAKAWVQYKHRMDKEGYDEYSYTDGGSRYLLDCNRLRSLSPDVAKHLASYKGNLRFGSLVSISEESASQLSKFKGPSLELASIKGISTRALRFLSRIKGELLLTGLRNISTAGAIELSKHKNHLALYSLSAPSVAAAAALAKTRCELDLRGLSSLSLGVAKALSKHNGILNLSGLKKVTSSLAKILVNHNGPIRLNGVKNLGKDAIKVLSKHPSVLLIN